MAWMRSSVMPTFSAVVGSATFVSPTMTCMRRYAPESAKASSRVLMMGRERVVAEDTASHIWSARWENCRRGVAAPVLIHPLPTRIWRVTKKATSASATWRKSRLRCSR